MAQGSADGGPEPPPDEDSVDLLLDRLEELEGTVDSAAEREGVREAMAIARDIPADGVFGEYIRKYTTRDMAEAFVGAVIFSIPLLVEDGVFAIADHFLRITVLGLPVFLLGNAVFVVLLTYGLIYWADIQWVQVNWPILGFIPRRLVGILLISFLTAALMMTLWGRLDGWADPAVAFARISVVWTIASIGASLGDILPGESGGEDINEVLDSLAE